MRFLAKLKSVDFYKKLPSDLTEATLTGASLSVISTLVMVALLVMEFSSFLSVTKETQIVIDRSAMGELMRVSFNISFSEMSCEHLTLDVSDALGTKKINLSKTVKKVPLGHAMEHAGAAMRDEKLPMPLYDSHNATAMKDIDITTPLTPETFVATKRRYPIVVVNFFAPWCPWCQRLAPTWELSTKHVHEKYPESDGRIRFAKVDCVEQQDLCRDEMITGFPTIRVYRKGSDIISVQGFKEHESYHGDRTEEALNAFADSLVPHVGNPGVPHALTRRMTLGVGCQISGFVLVKKVPGTLHFHMKQDGMTFDATDIEISHVVHQFSFGNRPTMRRFHQLSRLHPTGLENDWNDKLKGQVFQALPESSHEHYMQLILTTVEPLHSASYDAYDYTVHSHNFVRDDEGVPSAKFSYQTTAMQIVVKELGKQWYHFITTTCAIIGGVFTVCGILDGLSFTAYKTLKKVELGKQG